MRIVRLTTRAIVGLALVAVGSIPAATSGAASGDPATDQAVAAPTLPAYPEPAGARPDGWVELTDYTGTIQVVVPPQWRHMELMPATNDDGTPRPWLAATTEMNAFLPADGAPDTFSVPGMVFMAYPGTVDTQATLAGSEYHEVCIAQPVQRFVRGLVGGHLQEFTGCGGTATRLVYVAAHIDGAPHTYLLLVQLTGAADDAAVLDGLLSSFSPVTLPQH